jgi:site-specific recombinase XerD
MLEEINHFIQNLNSEYGNHKNTIISYKYDINQFNNFIKKKKKKTLNQLQRKTF